MRARPTSSMVAVLDLGSLSSCLESSACLVTQTTSGLIIGVLLFLVAVGLTLIFGVLKIVNFSHGVFYMTGAYFALTVFQATGSFALALLAGGLGSALVGLAVERLFMSRVYGANPLMQILVSFALILVFDDLARLIWGGEFRSMDMPAEFKRRPLRILGGVAPPYYLFVIAVTLTIGALLIVVLSYTRWGKIVRAAAHNAAMTSALGVNTTVVYALVFSTGCFLAGLAGALAAPVRTASPGMGFSILIDSFIVTVVGGMGSIAGALVGAVLIGLLRTFGAIGFPFFSDGLIYVFMVAVLVLRPSGLFGRAGG